MPFYKIRVRHFERLEKTITVEADSKEKADELGEKALDELLEHESTFIDSRWTRQKVDVTECQPGPHEKLWALKETRMKGLFYWIAPD